MKHVTHNGSPGGNDSDWRYLRLIAETQEDKETLEVLASITPHYLVDPDDDRWHTDYHHRTRKIFPVIKNEDGSHELRLVCIPPEPTLSLRKKERA